MSEGNMIMVSLCSSLNYIYRLRSMFDLNNALHTLNIPFSPPGHSTLTIITDNVSVSYQLQ